MNKDLKYIINIKENSCYLIDSDIFLNDENTTSRGVGYFIDKDSNYVVYKNRGERQVFHHIKLVTKDENEAFKRLRSLVEFILESNKGYF